MSTLKARTGLDIALLEDPDAFSFLLSGKNPDVDTAALEGIWEQGGDFNFESVDVAFELVSTSAADAAAGTGARKINVVMVNDDFSDFVVVEIIPNGTTPVPIDSPSTFMGCILIAVTEAGSGLNNAGDITVRTVVGSRVDEFAAAGRGRSLSARIRIPTNYVASVQRLHGSVDASKVMELEGVQRANADTATPAELVVLDEGALQAGAGDIDLAGGVTMNAAGEDDAGLALAGATDIFFRAKANANNSAITIFVLMTFRKVV